MYYYPGKTANYQKKANSRWMGKMHYYQNCCKKTCRREAWRPSWKNKQNEKWKRIKANNIIWVCKSCIYICIRLSISVTLKTDIGVINAANFGNLFWGIYLVKSILFSYDCEIYYELRYKFTTITSDITYTFKATNKLYQEPALPSESDALFFAIF